MAKRSNSNLLKIGQWGAVETGKVGSLVHSKEISSRPFRPTIWQVREMVGKDGIVKNKIVVSIGPVVTNVRVSLNDKVRNTKCIEACSNHKTVLTATDDEYGRIRFLKLDLFLAL